MSVKFEAETSSSSSLLSRESAGAVAVSEAAVPRDPGGGFYGRGSFGGGAVKDSGCAVYPNLSQGT